MSSWTTYIEQIYAENDVTSLQLFHSSEHLYCLPSKVGQVTLKELSFIARKLQILKTETVFKGKLYLSW